MRIDHVINLFSAPEGSEANDIQRITMESLRNARDTAQDRVEVELLSAQYLEDREVVPAFVRPTRDLDRSIRDLVSCDDQRKLPFVYDILQRACEESEAEFLIFSNADIGAYPGLYDFIGREVARGVDGMVVNRAQIPRVVRGRDLLKGTVEEVLSVRAKRPHPGADFFVFRRKAFEHWDPADVCVGYPPIGAYVLDQIEKHCNCFKWYTNVAETFHVGIDTARNSPWKRYAGNEIWIHNHEELERHRAFDEGPWTRHGFSRPRWAMLRLGWLIRYGYC